MGILKATWISLLLYGGITYLAIILFSYGKHVISNHMRKHYATSYSIFYLRNSRHHNAKKIRHPLFGAESRLTRGTSLSLLPRNISVMERLDLYPSNFKYVSRNPVLNFDFRFTHNEISFCRNLDSLSNSSSSISSNSFNSSIAKENPVINLLVLVCSSSSHFSIRKIIRQTWAKPRNYFIHPKLIFVSGNSSGRSQILGNRTEWHITLQRKSSTMIRRVKVLFLLGSPPDSNLQKNIDVESRTHGDIVQHNYLDTYKNLTIKSIVGLKWADRYCPNAKHVLKVDDDVIVNIDVLVNDLERRNLKKSIMGEVFTKGTFVKREPGHKWFVPRPTYPYYKFPPYVEGPAYVITHDIIKTLVARAQLFPFLFLEDVFVTGMLPLQQKIKLVNNAHFRIRPKVPLNFCSYLSSIALHSIDYEKQKLAVSKLWSLFNQWEKSNRSFDCSLINEISSFPSHSLLTRAKTKI